MNGAFAVSPCASSVLCQSRILSVSEQRCLSSSHNLIVRRGTPYKPPICGREQILCFKFRCNSGTNRGGSSGPEDNETKAILDAFFLGKALAEAVNERVESTVGEFLSAIGRLQAEQQKQVQDFQEDVLERAKRAKEKAAREAMEAQGLNPRSSISNEIKDQSNGVASVSTESNSSSSSTQPATSKSIDLDPLSGLTDED